MIRRPPRATRTDIPLPITTLVRSRQPSQHAAFQQTLQIEHDIELLRTQLFAECQHTTQQLHTLPGTPERFPFRLRPQNALIYIRILRSEEHTSELQSLMRISYAVFCLKQKNKQ